MEEKSTLFYYTLQVKSPHIVIHTKFWYILGSSNTPIGKSVKHILIIFSIFLFSLTIISCSSDDGSKSTDNTTNTTDTTSDSCTSSSSSSVSSITNNGSVLTGNNIGSCGTSNSQLSKSVTLTLQTPHSDISLGTPYVGRSSSTSETIYWSIPVNNTSSINSHCFIKLNTISFYDSSNTLLTVDSTSYLNGSMKKYSSSGYTDTCLLPNGNGYVYGIEIISNIYTNVSKIVVGNIDTSSSGLYDSDLSVIPQSYQTSGTYNDPLIKVTNQTSIKTKIWTSMIYLLDSNNNPIYWSSLGGGDIEPNSSLDLDDLIMFDGSVSKIHVFLNLDVYSSSRTIKRKESCTGTRDEKLSCYKDKRNNDIEQIRMELNWIEFNSLSSPVRNSH